MPCKIWPQSAHIWVFPIRKTKKLLIFVFCPTETTPSANIPDIHRVYVQLQSPYSFEIWWDSVHKSGIYNQKTVHWSFLSTKYRGPLSPKLGVGSQNNCLQKNVVGVLYPQAKFGGDHFTHGDTKPKESFLRGFHAGHAYFCLADLQQSLVLQRSIASPFVDQSFRGLRRFLEEETDFQTACVLLN